VKVLWLLAGVLLGFVLGAGFGPDVLAFWEARALRAEREALDDVEALLSDLDALPERRATRLNERVELARELAEYPSFARVSAEPRALAKLERLFAIEHEIIEIDERERWLVAHREELESLRERLSTHVRDEVPVAEADWPAIRAATDAAPVSTEPRSDGPRLQRLFESLGGA